MEKSSFAKFGLEAKEAMPRRDCGFYVKYIFLFTSLIQFLIILGLVLFMVYGNAQAGTDTHLRLLEAQVQDLYNKTLVLSGRNINLTRTLNATLKEKQGLQALAQKVQRDLEKCNSSQTNNPIPKLQEVMKIIFHQKMKLEQQKSECRSLKSEINYTFQRIRDKLNPYSCSSVHEQLDWLTQQTERLFLWQQDRETNYVTKKVCDVTLNQCHLNCSREKQELEKRLREMEKQVKVGQEEKKKVLGEKEQLGKELEEKSKAAAQATYFRDQFNICMNTKVDTFFDPTGSRVLGGSGRMVPFPSTSSYSSYVDALRNQGIFGNMGKINTEEIQRSVQKIIEQYTLANLKNSSG